MANPPSSIQFYEKIKRIALIAMFSDDKLMDMLVLKGGNALNLVYRIADRASLDLDFSIATKIEEENFDEIRTRILGTLKTAFDENRYVLIDEKFYERPREKREGHPEFWGGYRVEFKAVPRSDYLMQAGNTEALRRRAVALNSKQNKTFYIDISKYEFCEGKVEHELDGYTVYVYSPEMIVAEKLRAICQQTEKYQRSIVNRATGISPRPRDFYDIHLIESRLKVDLGTDAFTELLQRVFEAKKVPLGLLGELRDSMHFHKGGFKSLEETVLNPGELKSFEFYFDHVCGLAEKLINRLDS